MQAKDLKVGYIFRTDEKIYLGAVDVHVPMDAKVKRV